MLCDLITCYSIESAWFQRLKLKYDKQLVSFAFSFNLRRYIKVCAVLPALGEAVQVDPVKPTLKAPGI